MRKLMLIFGVTLACANGAQAAVPVCDYQDVISGPSSPANTGAGEGTGGTYIDVFGSNFGSSLSAIGATVNGVAVTNNIYLGSDATGDRQQFGFQVPGGASGTGAVTITVGGQTCQLSTATITSVAVASGLATFSYTGPTLLAGQSVMFQNLTSTAGLQLNYSYVQVLPGVSSSTFTANVPSHITNQSATADSGTASNGGFTVRSGNIWYIGSAIDNVTTGTTFSCANLKNGTAGDGNGGSGTYASPWTLTNVASVAQDAGSGNYGPATNARTPYTYYLCMSAGDTLVFLNGANYPYVGDAGLYTSLALNDAKGGPSTPEVIMARPGASASLGGQGYISFGLRTYLDTYVTIAGLSITGSGAGYGTGLDFISTVPNDRIVNNTIYCPDCTGSSAALTGGTESTTQIYNTNDFILGNLTTGVSCAASGGVSNKQFHALYFFGDGIEVGWNKTLNVCSYNGIQINYGGDNLWGFGLQAIHDNDIRDANGAGINMATMDPTQGPINIWNNVIHHVGVNAPSDDNPGGIHACISSPGEAPSAGAGTVYIYNNTCYDTAAYLAVNNSTTSCAIFYEYESAQTGLNLDLVNNLFVQPSYTYTGTQNPYMCTGTPENAPTITGSNNLFGSGGTPGSATPPTGTGLTSLTIPTNPAFVSMTSPGPWTYLNLQSTSPAIGAGTATLAPATDFAGFTRSSTSPAIGALEFQPLTLSISGSVVMSGSVVIN